MQWPWVVLLPTMLVGFLRRSVTHLMQMYSRYVLLSILEKTSQGALIPSPIQSRELASLWYHQKKPLLTNAKAVPTFCNKVLSIYIHGLYYTWKFKLFVHCLFAKRLVGISEIRRDSLEPNF